MSYKIEAVQLDAPTAQIDRFKGAKDQTYHLIFGFVPCTKEELEAKNAATYIDKGWYKEMDFGLDNGGKKFVKVPWAKGSHHYYENGETRSQFMCTGGECCKTLGPPTTHFGAPVFLVSNAPADYSVLQARFWKIPKPMWKWISSAVFSNDSPIGVTLKLTCEDDKFQKFLASRVIKDGKNVCGITVEQVSLIAKESERIMNQPPFASYLSDEQIHTMLSGKGIGAQVAPDRPTLGDGVVDISSMIKG